MAIIKCKMCGGNLSLEEDMTVAECEYCGTVQTVPKVDDEKKLKLFERANRLRAACDFDKAYGVYESIVADFDTEAEAYWGLILCKFGIEYVDDPATGKKVPTCHRSGFDCVLEDENFDLVMENCDDYSRRVYREEAKAIEELRKSILAVSSKEEPYDVFISYKELDATGERTIDSVIAQDIYERLTEKGYRVFFSRISLEDKLGVEYEPYIFAALNSAKLMLAVGTAYENFNAVWVKNEWSRYLAIMSKDHSKMLIPCFKDIDAYDMPKEFNKLAAQDMGKVGAMQDLLRGVEKIVGGKKEEAPAAAVQTAVTSGPQASSLLERGFMFLEDEEFESAEEYFDKVLDIEPKNGDAYFGKLMVELEASALDNISPNNEGAKETVTSANGLRRFKQFGSEQRKSELEHWFAKCDEAMENARIKKADETEQRIKKRSDYIERYPKLQRKEELHKMIAASSIAADVKESLCSSDRVRIQKTVNDTKKAIKNFMLVGRLMAAIAVVYLLFLFDEFNFLIFVLSVSSAGLSAYLLWYVKDLKAKLEQYKELLELCDIPTFEEYLEMQKNEELNSKDISTWPENEQAQ